MILVEKRGCLGKTKKERESERVRFVGWMEKGNNLFSFLTMTTAFVVQAKDGGKVDTFYVYTWSINVLVA